MAKKVTDGFLDGGLNAIDGATTLTVCAGEPISIADITTKKLANVVIDGTDFTKANGDTSGRKVTIAQQSNMSITASGSADHVVLDDGVDYYVTTCTTQALTSGGTVTVPAWDIEFADPT